MPSIVVGCPACQNAGKRKILEFGPAGATTRRPSASVVDDRPVQQQPLEQLLRRCQRGDELALEMIVRDYQDRIFRLAFRVVRDEVLAEEATVATLYKVWSKASQWREGTAAETWLFRIAVRTVLDARRSRRRWWRWNRAGESNGTVDRMAEDSQPGPVEQAIDRDEREWRIEQLDLALEQLDDESRTLVHLFYYEERGLSEIASIMDVSVAALKGRLFRVRQRLRLILDDSGEFDEQT